MKGIKQHLSLFAFLALMLIKVTSFHVYAHQDDDTSSVEDCEICDLALENQTTEIAFDIPASITSHQIFIEKELLLVEKQVNLSSTREHLYLFLRPPPVA